MASQTETWTVGRLLQWTTDHFKQQGAENPRLDAEVLLAEARGCQRIALYTCYDEVPDEKVRTAFRELVRRRSQGTPVAYLVGRRDFYSLTFHVTPDVLIPRPETELLVVRVLELARPLGQQNRKVEIADVGTGSGNITVAVAKHLKSAQFAAIDVSPAALDVARKNAERHNVAERIQWHQSDLFAMVPPDRQFDFIVSNPPYVTTAEMDQLSPTVRDHEPRQALEAGPRGTEIIERLLIEAGPRLRTGGWLLVETSPMLEQSVRTLFESHTEFELGPTIKDLAGHARVVQVRKAT